MGILDAPGLSPVKNRLSSLYNRLGSANANPFGTIAPAVDIPTITTSTTATVTNGAQFGVNSGLVTEVGSRGTYQNAFNRYVVSGLGGPAGLDFYLTGTTIELCVSSTGTGNLPLWVWVNGLPVTLTPDTTTVNAASAGADLFVKLVFPSNTRRRVEVFLSGGASLSSWRPIRTDNATLVTPAPRRPVVAFVSDSYFAGNAAAIELQCGAFIMSRLLGVECLDISWGGTGYVNTGSFTVYGSTTRTNIAANAQPELIVFSGSGNDDANSAASVGTAAAAAYAAFAAACPKARAIVFGPQPNSALNTIGANRAANIAAIKTAAAAAPMVLAFHDMIGTAAGVPAAWVSSTTYSDGALVTYKGSVWKAVTNGATFTGDTPGASARWSLQTYAFTGTGNTGAPVGDGNRDTYLFSDSVHPTPEGGAALAIRQANLVREDLRLATL